MLIESPTAKRVCTVDTETNPFEPPARDADGKLIGTRIKPFTVGFYDGSAYFDFWGDDCVSQFFAHLSSYEDELLIYAHNGGGFDFFFFMDYIDEDKPPVIIRGRLTKMWFQGQEFRDSYKIIPTSLASYQKDHIDYMNFVPEKRESFKRDILLYQRSDCLYLYDLVSAYQNTFGDSLTIGSTSIKVLTEFHPWEKLTKHQDASLRPYYFGGRNQCFETGIMLGLFQIYDVNSMYPRVMRDMLHPVGKTFSHHRKIREGKTAFVCFEGVNGGAVPIRAIDGSLSFTQQRGKFMCTIHEFNAGLESNTLIPQRILHTVECDKFTSFCEFINHFYDLRLTAKELDDIIYDLFYKLLMNNSYGKFAQDPSTYKDYCFTLGEMPSKGKLWSPLEPNGWQVETTFDIGPVTAFVWAKPARSTNHGYKNVATAASITGAARAELLRGLASATRPIYCDTDSIICEALDADLDGKRLGAWKHEATCEVIAVAGKKLYAALTQDLKECRKKLKLKDTEFPESVVYAGEQYWCIKKASKGVKLSAQEIVSVAMGETVEYANPVPHFKMDGSQDYVSRKIRATGAAKFGS